MDQETFNLSIRKFLKMVGVNSQREIEQAVQKALDGAALKGDETFAAKVTLEIPSLGRQGALRRRDQTKIVVMNKAREFDQSVVAELKALLGDRVSTSAAVREHHGKDESYFPYALPDAVVFPKTTEEVRDVVNICRRHRVPMIPYGVGTSLEGHILAVQGRRVHRPVADEPGARGARGGPRRGGAGRRHAQAAERTHQAHRPVLPGRPGRRRDARRHGGDARLGHQRGALRHHARERAVAEGGARRRPHHPDLAPREEIRRGLRPDAPVRRLGRHARHHHRGDGAALPGAGSDVGGGLRLRHRSTAAPTP